MVGLNGYEYYRNEFIVVYSIVCCLLPLFLRGDSWWSWWNSPFSAPPADLSHAYNQRPAEWPGPTRSKHKMAASAVDLLV